MTEPDTSARVIAVLATHFCRPPGSIDAATSLASLGADSLDALEIAFDLEDELGRDFDALVPDGWHTVGDVIEAVEGIIEGAEA